MTYHASTGSGLAITDLTDAGALQTGDAVAVYRSNTWLKSTNTNLLSLFRVNPAGSRTVTLPATITASDNGKIILLQGSAGNLSIDNTLPDGFRCTVINTASGDATYIGIIGLNSTTVLTAQYATTIYKVGQSVYAAPFNVASQGGSTPAITVATPSDGVQGATYTLHGTYTGTAPSGVAYRYNSTGSYVTATGFSVNTGASTWTSTATYPNTSAAFTVQVQETNATTVTAVSGSFTVSASAPATQMDVTMQNTTGAPNIAQNVAIFPDFGNQVGWPSGVTITPILTGNLTGTFSITTAHPTGTDVVDLTFTPTSAVGTTGTISATNDKGMTVAFAATFTVANYATGFTVTGPAQSTVSNDGIHLTSVPYTTIAVGELASFALDPTPTGSVWPSGINITAQLVSGATGTATFQVSGSGPGGAVGDTTTSVIVGMTATGAGTANVRFLNDGSLPQPADFTFTINGTAHTGVTWTQSTTSGNAGAPHTITLTPTGGVWRHTRTVFASLDNTSTATGSFSPTYWNIPAGTTTALDFTLTPSTPGNAIVFFGFPSPSFQPYLQAAPVTYTVTPSSSGGGNTFGTLSTAPFVWWDASSDKLFKDSTKAQRATADGDPVRMIANVLADNGRDIFNTNSDPNFAPVFKPTGVNGHPAIHGDGTAQVQYAGIATDTDTWTTGFGAGDFTVYFVGKGSPSVNNIFTGTTFGIAISDASYVFSQYSDSPNWYDQVNTNDLVVAVCRVRQSDKFMTLKVNTHAQITQNFTTTGAAISRLFMPFDFIDRSFLEFGISTVYEQDSVCNALLTAGLAKWS